MLLREGMGRQTFQCILMVPRCNLPENKTNLPCCLCSFRLFAQLLKQQEFDAGLLVENGCDPLIEHVEVLGFGTVKDVGAVVIEAEYGLDEKKAALRAEEAAVFPAVRLLGHADPQQEVDQHLDGVGVAGHVGTAAAAAGTSGAAPAELAQIHGPHVPVEGLGMATQQFKFFSEQR